MRFAIIKNNLVVNVVEGDAAAQLSSLGDHVVYSEVASIGDAWNGSSIVPAVRPSVALQNQPEPVIVVTPRQAKIALARANLLAAVESFMAGLPANDELRISWQEALSFRRDSDMVAGMAQLLNLSAAEIDALFLSAAQID